MEKGTSKKAREEGPQLVGDCRGGFRTTMFFSFGPSHRSGGAAHGKAASLKDYLASGKVRQV